MHNIETIETALALQGIQVLELSIMAARSNGDIFVSRTVPAIGISKTPPVTYWCTISNRWATAWSLTKVVPITPEHVEIYDSWVAHGSPAI